MSIKTISQLQKRIDRIKKRICDLGDLRPGKLSQQYNVCGKKNCRCKDKKDPIKHGPYYQISYTHRGKSRSEFVKKKNVSEVKRQLKNFSTFRELTNEWIDAALELTKLKKKLMESQES